MGQPGAGVSGGAKGRGETIGDDLGVPVAAVYEYGHGPGREQVGDAAQQLVPPGVPGAGHRRLRRE
jgi:hypothetical protein